MSQQSIYWTFHGRLPAVLARRSRPSSTTPVTAAVIHNPFEGQVASARQLNESPSDFVNRLAPSQIHRDDAGPWLWIADPCQKHEFLDHDHSRLLADGEQLLRQYKLHKQQMEAKSRGIAMSTNAKRLRAAQNQLAENIRLLALECNVKTGKWMLFPRIEALDRTWQAICEAVVSGKLGSTAKVATGGSERGHDGVRLICVYTRDFTNEEDIKRVLDRLLRMGLVDQRREANGIWYKLDAYTHLGIESGNEYGLKASLFGSRALLRDL